ncbi:MAG: hypothetical protein PV344_04610 [Anaplasma sp.]|nr:hypothetical protein [Anaplasma sp.]
MLRRRSTAQQKIWELAEGVYCKRLNFRGLKFSRIGPKLNILNYSRVLIFANRM